MRVRPRCLFTFSFLRRWFGKEFLNHSADLPGNSFPELKTLAQNSSTGQSLHLALPVLSLPSEIKWIHGANSFCKKIIRQNTAQTYFCHLPTSLPQWIHEAKFSMWEDYSARHRPHLSRSRFLQRKGRTRTGKPLQRHEGILVTRQVRPTHTIRQIGMLGELKTMCDGPKDRQTYTPSYSHDLTKKANVT